MPITAERERELLNHYHITTLYPTEWPHQNQESSDEEEVEHDPQHMSFRRHTSKLSRTSLTDNRGHLKQRGLEATEKYDDADSLVQKDEPDPLGKAPSVAAELRRRGLPVEDNIKLRNRFMLSSTSFSPALFLSQVHHDASTEDLLRGLDFLSHSIEQKSASLKVLVESNFEKFVRAKATIDNVYTEMRTQGADPRDSLPPPSGRMSHSRHTSRNSQTHFRATSGTFGSTSRAILNDKKKTALTKESEYGVQGIKAPLQDLSLKAEEVWGPALGGREKEETLKVVLSAMEQYRDIFRLSGAVHDYRIKNDYDGVVEEYRKAKRYVMEAKTIADAAKLNAVQLGDADAQQIILTAKMWHDVTKEINEIKADLWKRLKSSHGRNMAPVSGDNDKEVHMELIGTLLQLDVDENPIWAWLNSRHLYLRSRVARTFERSRIELEILRRRLANNESVVDAKVLAKFLRSAAFSAGASHRDSLTAEIDAPAIVAFWEKLRFSLTEILSTSHGLLGEVVEFWEAAQAFIDNVAQKDFPSAVFASGLEHLQLDPTEIRGLRSGAIELVELIRNSVLSLFADPPVQDLSELYSPIPPTPITPDSGSALTPVIKRSFSFDPSTVPPPSPSRGEAWEKYAFWAPHSNSLSGSFYLGQISIMIGTAANAMASLTVSKQAREEESLKALINAIRERCIQAVCASWTIDAERCKFMEVWIRTTDRKDLTTMPAAFMSFEEKVLQNVQRIAYISEAVSVKGGTEVVLSPPAKLLQAIRGTFVTSLYKALSGMVENAERLKTNGRGESDPDGITLHRNSIISSVHAAAGESPVDSTNKNIRMLMTLSNLAHLRSDIIPHLVSQFENSFAVKLTDENKTIRDVLTQIDSHLFQSYIKPTVELVTKMITKGITDPSWVPHKPRPSDASSYIYDVLLVLVLVHCEVSTSATALTNHILSYLLEQCSLALINAFRTRARYELPALMQATLDVEFLAQTLNNFTTDRAGEIQSQIYLALDERTDDDARKKLQSELADMRTILKKLRENTKGEFHCFRKERRGRDRTGTNRAPT